MRSNNLLKVFTCTESAHTLFLSQISGIIHIIILTLIACALLLTPHRIVIAQTVHIPDPNLRAALKLALGKEVSADITQAEMESLESLDAFEAGVRDLTGLEFAINLAVVYLGLNEIVDVSALKGLTKLTGLDLHRNGKISDVSPLKGLTNLTWLSLRGNGISDVSPLKGLTNLTYLHVAYNNISDVSALETLTSLTFLDVEANRKIPDLSSFSVLTNLTYLDFDCVGISDLSPLQTLTKLEELDASDNQISNISVLKNLTKLRNLDLDDNQISDISSLSTLTELTWLDLDDNQILDASPLKGLTNLRWLDLDHSRISDVSPLKDLYCHRKFGPLSKTRLWYNIHLLERSIRWRNANEETSRPSLKPKLFLRHSAVKLHKQKCVGNPITSAMNNFQSGSDSFLKMRKPPSLNLLINSLMPLRSGSPNLSNSLGG